MADEKRGRGSFPDDDGIPIELDVEGIQIRGERRPKAEPICVMDLERLVQQQRDALQADNADTDLEWIPAAESHRLPGPLARKPVEPMFDSSEDQEDDVVVIVETPDRTLRVTAPERPPRPPAPELRSLPLNVGTGLVAMDFGTTRCRVAAMVEGKVYLLPMPDGRPDMPAVVWFDRRGGALVGEDARAMLPIDPVNVVVSPRRLLGRLYRDPAIAGLLADLPMASSEGANGEIVLHPRGRMFAVSQVCATVLAQLRRVAEHHLQREVTSVVLTTPVDFDERQTRALGLAASMAGLDVLQFVEEPVAAAVANCFGRDCRDLVGVYDFGGATFDFSVVDLNDQMRVVASAADPWLGGNDFEMAVADAAANHFWWEHKVELRHNSVQWQRLLLQAERAKRDLSRHEATMLELSDVARTRRGALSVRFPLTRTRFTELSRGLIDRSLDTCREALESQDLSPSDLKEVFLSSGTSYIPAVQRAVGQFFGSSLRPGVPPERAVLLGSAIYAACLREARGQATLPS
jgi:molecular chaperone DnaK